VTVVDVRKSFESEVGTFSNAINLKLVILENFRSILKNFQVIRIKKLQCFVQAESVVKKPQAI